jgi:tetratricopeptide (TPR) repeat protein
MPSYPVPPRHRRILSPSQRLLRRAERLAEQGRCAQAVASLERAIAAGADAYEAALRIAEQCRARQEWPYALLAAEKAVALAPKRLLAYEALTAIALEAGLYERAVQTSLLMLKLAPKHLPAHNALGVAYMQMGNLDAAMRTINTLIRLDPLSPAHHFKKGLLCQDKNEIGLAMQEFAEVIRLDRNGPYAEAAQEALDMLDTFQIDQIITLASEDIVFRAKLLRDTIEAVLERGFTLTENGMRALQELSMNLLPETTGPARLLHYN